MTANQPTPAPAPAQQLPQFVEAASPSVVTAGVDERLIHLAEMLGAISKGIFSLPCVITSGRDSLHVQGSKHASGQAIDIRTKDKTPEQIALLLHLIHYCGPSYNVSCFDESMLGEQGHIHLEIY